MPSGRYGSGLGFPRLACAEQVVITPACGLAGVSPDQARDALRWCREAGAHPAGADGGAGLTLTLTEERSRDGNDRWS